MKSGSNARERILGYGGPGAGKSNAWVDIALWEQRTGENHLYVVNSDPGRVDRARDAFELGNVTSVDCFGFEDMTENMKKYREAGKRDDWLVVDMVDLLYDWCQDFFMEQALMPEQKSEAGSAAEFMLEYRKKSANNPITDSAGWGLDWQIVKRLYRDAMSNIHKFPGHVYVASPAEQVRQPDKQGKGGDPKDIMSVFGKWGVKPAGEKRLGHSFPTIILYAAQGNEWIYNTVRDNNRELQRGKKLTGFASDYLVEVAGWEM